MIFYAEKFWQIPNTARYQQGTNFVDNLKVSGRTPSLNLGVHLWSRLCSGFGFSRMNYDCRETEVHSRLLSVNRIADTALLTRS